jgi:hypothetical protein
LKYNKINDEGVSKFNGAFQDPIAEHSYETIRVFLFQLQKRQKQLIYVECVSQENNTVPALAKISSPNNN